MDGLVFGIMDNAILLAGAYTGFSIDEKLGGNGRIGGILGAGLGNTISDGLGALIDPTMSGFFLGIVLGCLIPMLAIPVIEKIKNVRELKKKKEERLKKKEELLKWTNIVFKEIKEERKEND